MDNKGEKGTVEMTTKEKITNEALTLFSTKGYKGTSVKNIADAVNIKDSSLYKHFKSKQAILDSIVDLVWRHIENMSETYGLPDDLDYKKAAAFYSDIEEDDLVELSQKIFLFYLKDSVVSRFWKMGNIEQFQNPKIYSLFSNIFLEESISYQTALFDEMRKEKIFIDVDSKVMAISFYTPIYFLLCKYANHMEREKEALEILEKQVREFYRIYRSK